MWALALELGLLTLRSKALALLPNPTNCPAYIETKSDAGGAARYLNKLVPTWFTFHPEVDRSSDITL